MQEVLINFDDPAEKRVLWDFLKTCKGRWRITACRYRRRRSDVQNRYYWGVVVRLFGDFLRDQGEQYTDEDAHEVLKAAFLRKSIVNQETGEIICETVGSTAKLTTGEFIEYLDKCVAWLADMFHIVVPDPNQYRIGTESDEPASHTV